MATTPCCHIPHHFIIPTKPFTQTPSSLSHLHGRRRRATRTATRRITTLTSAGPISLLQRTEQKSSSSALPNPKHEHGSSTDKSPRIQHVQVGNAFDISSVDFEKFGQSLALGFLSLAVSATTLLAPLVDDGRATAASYPCENTEEYYAGLKDLKGSKLKSELHKLIKGHQVYTYAQVWEALKILDAADDQDPAASPDVNDIYSARRFAKSLAGDSEGWNREHLWPRSYGLGSSLPEFSDLHNLRPADVNVNSARSNKVFGECTPEGGKCLQPANREAGDDTATNTSLWTPPTKVRGDIARALMYMAVRYEGEQAGSKDLELTDAPNITEGRMGLLSPLLKWHAQDPPSATEKLRNGRVCSLYQHNRNPFVDHPEYAALIWSSPAGLADNREPDTSSFTGLVVDEEPGKGTTGGGGKPTVPDVAIVTLDSSIPAWINEIHYDNKGVDVNEFVEVAVGPGVDPRDLRVVLYNGGNKQAYKTMRLVTGESGPQPSGFRFFSAKADGLQNGPQDGVALVIAGGEGGGATPKVIQFLSYEGKLAAQDGPANGLTSVDIGLEEGDSTPEGSSLGLTGRGSKYADFTWTSFRGDSTPGAANKGEVIVSP